MTSFYCRVDVIVVAVLPTLHTLNFIQNKDRRKGKLKSESARIIVCHLYFGFLHF